MAGESGRVVSRVERLRVSLRNAYLDQNRLAEAEASYQHALALNPAPPEPYVNLSLLRSGERRYSQAITLAEAALQRDSGSALAHYARAVAYEGLGRFEEAAQSYQQTLKLDPGFTEAEERLRAISATLRHS